MKCECSTPVCIHDRALLRPCPCPPSYTTVHFIIHGRAIPSSTVMPTFISGHAHLHPRVVLLSSSMAIPLFIIGHAHLHPQPCHPFTHDRVLLHPRQCYFIAQIVHLSITRVAVHYAMECLCSRRTASHSVEAHATSAHPTQKDTACPQYSTVTCSHHNSI